MIRPLINEQFARKRPYKRLKENQRDFLRGLDDREIVPFPVEIFHST